MEKLLTVFVLSIGIFQINALQFSDVIYLSMNLWAKVFYEAPLVTDPIIEEEYDFIVIGSGSAGATVTNRLTENPNWKVLLLEAGTLPNDMSEIPYWAAIYQVSPYNWGYTMEKQEGICNAMEEGICAWPRGKALGGTTTINYMIYTRGNPIDYQKWEALGNPGWSYEDVLPYYLKSEECHLGEICQTEYHNTGGLLSTEYSYESKIAEPFIDGAVELGSIRTDYNSKNQTGFSRIQATHKNGKRHSVKSAFLDPIKNRSNLDILTKAKVTKILIDPDTKEAYGVEYNHKNQTHVVRARKEVILSAGTFHSPQLLMLSGIGPEEDLKEFSIPVIKDLAVGKTLYDHITPVNLLFTINQTTDNILQSFDPMSWVNWSLFGKGVFTSNSGIDNIGYIRTNVSDDVEGYPDLEIMINSFGGMNYDMGLVSRAELRVRQEIYDDYFRPLVGIPSYGILPMLLHPKSKGYMKLRSASPFDSPKLYGNYYTDPKGHDMKTMIKGVRYAQKHAKTQAMQKFGAKEYTRPFPGCENSEYDTDTYWECVLRSATVTVHHQVATCKMGPETDAEAVVDNRLKVYGVKKLRVADSSVIPIPLSAHTNAPSIMIGEQLGDFLKEDWKNM